MFCFARRKFDAGEAFQFADRLLDTGFGVADVELYDFGSRNAASVGDVDTNGRYRAPIGENFLQGYFRATATSNQAT